MKKLICVFLSVLMLCGFSCGLVFAEENDIDVYVTIAIKGEFVSTYTKVSVNDADNDGSITVADALFALHEAKYDGGAAKGFATADTEYGLSLIKLWGDDSGFFGYQNNNTSCMSLGDEVKDGDHVYAYVYTDTENWSDAYSFFDKATVSADGGKEVTLVLNKSGYDANWTPITLPVGNAVITIDGEETEYITDADGKVTIVFEEAGKYTISAKSNDVVIVPPVCIFNVKTEESLESGDNDSIPNAGDNEMTVLYVILVVVSLVSAFIIYNRKTVNEK